MVRKLKVLVAQRVSELLVKLPKLDHYVPILCYHRVLPEFIEDVNDPIYTVLPEQFESQMDFLAQEGFHTLSLTEFAATARGLRPLAKRSVLVTFDDGYADNYAVAWPIAKKFNVTLNLFICTAYQGQPHPLIMTRNGYRLLSDFSRLEAGPPDLASHIKKFPELWRSLTWQELAIMRDDGVEIALHSHAHRDFALLDPRELAQEITTGIDIFTKELGYRPKFFALPYGGYYTSTPAVLEILKGFGLEFIFSTHIGRPRLPCPRLVFPRLQILQQDDLAVFQRKLDGGYDWLGPIYRLIQLTGLDRPHRY
jgi:peptidoglycan/xylan/chitin deacetylase (PgdA/CDA1 family)